jgi:hypothetical protein
MKFSNKINYPLLAIFFTALIFRFFDLNNPFPTSDHISVSHLIIKNFSFDTESLKNIMSYYHGSAAPLLGFVTAAFAQLLHIPLTEVVWRAPFSLLGSLVVFPLFSIGKMISDRRAGWFAGWLIAIYPWHVYISRSPGLGHKSFSIFLQILALSALIHFLKSQNIYRTRNLAVALTMVILFDIFFPFTLIALILISIYSFKNKKRLTNFFRQKILGNKLFSLVILPIFVLFFILLAKESIKINNLNLAKVFDFAFDFMLPFGLFFFYLFLFLINKIRTFHKPLGLVTMKKQTVLWLLPTAAMIFQIFSLISGFGGINQGRNVTDGWGFYGKEFLANAFHFSGIPILIVMIFFLINGIWQLKRKKAIGILVLWSLAIAAPFFFIFNRLPTFYFPIVITPLIVLTGVSIAERINSLATTKIIKFFYTVIFIFISSFFLLITIGGLAGSEKITSWQKRVSSIKCNPDCGELIYPDYGIKAAAYWFRTHTTPDTQIFAYTVGSVPFEPPTIDYYFRRPNISLFNGSLQEINQRFKSHVETIDYLMITTDELPEVEEEVNAHLFLRVTIVNDDDPVLFIYSRRLGDHETIDSQTGSRLFDKYFTTRENLFI